MSTLKRYIFCLALCIVMSGCGYTTKSTLPGHLKTVHIEAVKNKIDYSAERSRNIYFPLIEVNVRAEEGFAIVLQQCRIPLLIGQRIKPWFRKSHQILPASIFAIFGVRVKTSISTYFCSDPIIIAHQIGALLYPQIQAH